MKPCNVNISNITYDKKKITFRVIQMMVCKIAFDKANLCYSQGLKASFVRIKQTNIPPFFIKIMHILSNICVYA